MSIKMSEAVQESTGFVAKGTAVCTGIMLLCFGGLHAVTKSVPFDAGVVLGAVLGFAVAAGNFLLMAVGAEKAAADDNYDNAKRKMTLSYRYRTFGQILFMILALVVPVINPVAAIVPLLVPGILIRGRGVVSYRRKRD